MTHDQALQVLAVLTAGYPNFTLERPTAELWVRALSPVPVETAREAASQLVMESRFFPTIAEFNERRRLVAQQHSVTPFKALPAPAVDPEQQKANVVRLREVTRTAVKKLDASYKGLPRRLHREPAVLEFCTDYPNCKCKELVENDPSGVVPRGLSTEKKRLEMTKLRERKAKAEERDQRVKEVASDAAREVAQTYLNGGESA